MVQRSGDRPEENTPSGVLGSDEGRFLAPVEDETFDVVIANLTADLLLPLVPQLRCGELFIAGGKRARGGWVAFLAGRGDV